MLCDQTYTVKDFFVKMEAANALLSILDKPTYCISLCLDGEPHFFLTYRELLGYLENHFPHDMEAITHAVFEREEHGDNAKYIATYSSVDGRRTMYLRITTYTATVQSCPLNQPYDTATLVSCLESRLAHYEKAEAMWCGRIPYENNFDWPSSPSDPANCAKWRGAIRELRNTLDMLRHGCRR